MIISAYRVGPRTILLLWTYWGRLTMVARARSYFGIPFKVYYSITQGDPLYPMIFNVVLEDVIRHWVEVVSPTEDGTEVLRLLIHELAMYFYSNDGLVPSTNTESPQRAFDVLTGLFNQVDLGANTRKTVSMACHPFHAPRRMYLAAYERRTTGMRTTFLERQRSRVACPEYGVEVAAGSLLTHHQRQHGVGRGDQGRSPPPAPLGRPKLTGYLSLNVF